MKTTNTTNLHKFGYKQFVVELQPLIERYLRQEDVNLSVFGIKLINRENGEAEFLVITNQKTLWTFRYNFDNPSAWKDLQLQNSARHLERKELRSLESAYTDIQGKHGEELANSTMRFFMDTPTCLQREEQRRLNEEAKKSK